MDEKEVVDHSFMLSVVDFIRTYADRTHHGKEEDILFEQLKSKQMDSNDNTMMFDLIEEHKTARRVVSELVQAEADYFNGQRAQMHVIVNKLIFLTDFYPVHIAKEDKLFFPNTERYFQDAELAQMLNDFYNFDRNMIHEKYNKLYEALSSSRQNVK